MMKTRYYIGIDAGTHTGLSVWDSKERKFLNVTTLKLWEAMEYVKKFYDDEFLLTEDWTEVKVIVEDARKRKWFGERSQMKQQGAGSIKRDCSIWEEFLTDNGIPFEMVAPVKGCTKWTAEHFKAITGWGKRTSEHARDASMLVFGR